VMAVPLAAGYLAAHLSAHHVRHSPFAPLRRRVVTFLDGRAILLTAAGALMMVALVATLSRSGLFGIAAAALTGLLMPMRRPGARGGVLVGIAAAAVAAGLLVFAAMPPRVIADRLARTQVSAADRLTIWQDTLPVIRDFWLTGTGAGTYETSMLVFQRASP